LKFKETFSKSFFVGIGATPQGNGVSFVLLFFTPAGLKKSKSPTHEKFSAVLTHRKRNRFFFSLHFCADRNEAKNGFWEGTYPFPKSTHPSPAKPPDHYGRFCSRRETRRGVAVAVCFI
jgi:hypothetical protein